MAVQTEKVLDILIYGDITSWEWFDSDVSSYTLSKLIKESDAEQIIVRINSYGGEVAEGLAIYNALRNHPAAVKTVCDGFACSAASVVFMAGKERLMNEASLLMIHNAWSNASGNAKELRKAAEDLEKISTAAANAYRACMTITNEELENLLDKESWITPQEALSYGFATDVLTQEVDQQKQQYSVRKRVYEQLVSKAEGGADGGTDGLGFPKETGPSVIQTAAQEPAGFKKLFDKFTKKEKEGE